MRKYCSERISLLLLKTKRAMYLWASSVGISDEGKLQVELEDEILKSFDMKEIQLIVLKFFQVQISFF